MPAGRCARWITTGGPDVVVHACRAAGRVHADPCADGHLDARGRSRRRCAALPLLIDRTDMPDPAPTARTRLAPTPPTARMSGLIRSLIRPYRAWLIIVFAAMMVETLMSLAAPWPLKMVLDNALGNAPAAGVARMGARPRHRPRHDGSRAVRRRSPRSSIAVIGRSPTYIDNYYTDSVGQWVANDLRMRIYEHLHRLSLGYYDTTRPARCCRRSPATSSTVQNFASSATLSILVDMHDDRRHAGHHVLARLGLHADRRRRHAVPAAVRLALQEGGEGRHARGAQAAERDRRGGAAGPGLGARR